MCFTNFLSLEFLLLYISMHKCKDDRMRDLFTSALNLTGRVKKDVILQLLPEICRVECYPG